MSLLSQFSTGGVTKEVMLVEIFGVGGGGGGGAQNPPTGDAGGGGGAGAVIYQQLEVGIGVTYTISIGGGGAAGTGSTVISTREGNSGNSTSFGNNIFGYTICYGGGGGGGGNVSCPASLGSTGGMGRNTEYGEFTIVTPYISPTRTAFENATNSNYLYLTSPGNVDAITSPGPSSQNIVSCGGGGAGGQFDTPGILGVDGVPGDYIGIPGSSFGGGGGGHPGGAGGTGGGGNGGASPTNIGSNATANTGGGGGGGVPAGGSGGSGVFFVRYPTSYAAATVTGNTPTPAQSGYYVYRWNSGPGTIIFN